MYTVYGRSRPTCSACETAKSVLTQKGIEFEYIDVVSNGITPQELQKKAGVPIRTVPVIFEGEKFIGGKDDLVRELERKGV